MTGRAAAMMPLPLAQNDAEGADQRLPEGLSTAACFQVIEDGTAAWGGSRKREDLRLSSSEIPDGKLRRNGDLGFDTSLGKGVELSKHALTSGLCSNLAGNHSRHDELFRELAQKGDMSDLAKQDEGGGIDDPQPTHARSLR